MINHPVVRFGLAGLGGYASHICDTLLADMRRANPSVQLVSVFEPELSRFPNRSAPLREQGIQLLSSYEELLASAIEAVWLPLPIDLHRSFTERALAAGKAVLCEKPAAGSVDDVDAMIEARDRSGLVVAIGFQDIYEPAVLDLKKRILAGEFGAPRNAAVLGCWPRSERYFTRNKWAGRFKRDDVWVLDSPANNAMAHFLHLPLVLLGADLHRAAVPLSVDAELYRANPIESYDTCTIRYTLGGNVPLYICYTHACDRNSDPIITLEFEKASVCYRPGLHIQITTPAGSEVIQLAPEPRIHMLQAFQQWMRSGQCPSAGGTLETARAHAVCINAAAEAAHVHSVPAAAIERSASNDGSPLNAIRGITAALQHCVSNKCLLNESGLAAWSRPAGSMTIDAYTHFAGPRSHKVRVNVSPAAPAGV